MLIIESPDNMTHSGKMVWTKEHMCVRRSLMGLITCLDEQVT